MDSIFTALSHTFAGMVGAALMKVSRNRTTAKVATEYKALAEVRQGRIQDLEAKVKDLEKRVADMERHIEELQELNLRLQKLVKV